MLSPIGNARMPRNKAKPSGRLNSWTIPPSPRENKPRFPRELPIDVAYIGGQQDTEPLMAVADTLTDMGDAKYTTNSITDKFWIRF